MTNNIENGDPFLNVDGIAGYLGVSVRFVWHEIARGHLTAVRFGRLVRVRRSELERYIAGNSSGASRGLGA